jgi:hypothetical protein
MKLTGNYYLRRRILGGYNVYVEMQDITGVMSNYWRRAKPEEVAQVLNTNVI